MPNLLFCMTPGVGLNDWLKIGTLNRELKVYSQYIRQGWQVKIITFDKNPIPELPSGMTAAVLKDSRNILFIPWLYREIGNWADVIKTNQSHLSWFYALAAKIWHKPFLLRCGYVHGEYLETTGAGKWRTSFYQSCEGWGFRQADKCIVTTEKLASWIRQKYGVGEGRIEVIPNFVDTAIYKKIEGVQKQARAVVSIGRLEPVKRFELLIEACAGIPQCRLTIIGQGQEREKLRQLAQQWRLHLELPGNIPYEKLPRILNEHSVFAMTPLREGHPKALIEAMACGLPCVAIRAKGIDNIIKNGENGFLTDDAKSLGQVIETLLEDATLAEKMSRAAVASIKGKYELDECFKRELRLASSILGRKK